MVYKVMHEAYDCRFSAASKHFYYGTKYWYKMMALWGAWALFTAPIALAITVHSFAALTTWIASTIPIMGCATAATEYWYTYRTPKKAWAAALKHAELMEKLDGLAEA